jgi:hypothetical protein
MNNSKVLFQNPNQPYRLENGVREAMLKRDEEKGLVVLEGLYTLNFASETWMTFDEIYRLLRDNFGMSYQLVYKGLQTKLIFLRRKSEGVANRRGARPYLYRVPCPQEIKVEYAPDLKPTPSDNLIRTDLRSVSAYRIGLHRELVTRLWIENGGKGVMMYRDMQAERLNVSVRTVRTYDKLLGFSHEANYIEREITPKNWNELPRYKSKFDENGKRLPSRKWLKVVDWQSGQVETLPHVRYLAYINLNEQKAVYEVERTANTYYPYQRPETCDLREYDYDPSMPYLLDKEARNKAGLYQDGDGKWYHQRSEWSAEVKVGYWQNSDGEWYHSRE